MMGEFVSQTKVGIQRVATYLVPASVLATWLRPALSRTFTLVKAEVRLLDAVEIAIFAVAVPVYLCSCRSNVTYRE